MPSLFTLQMLQKCKVTMHNASMLTLQMLCWHRCSHCICCRSKLSGIIFEEAVAKCQTETGLKNAIARGDVIKKETDTGVRYYFPRTEIGESESYLSNTTLTTNRRASQATFTELKTMIADLNWTIKATDANLEAIGMFTTTLVSSCARCHKHTLIQLAHNAQHHLLLSHCTAHKHAHNGSCVQGHSSCELANAIKLLLMQS